LDSISAWLAASSASGADEVVEGALNIQWIVRAADGDRPGNTGIVKAAAASKYAAAMFVTAPEHFQNGVGQDRVIGNAGAPGPSGFSQPIISGMRAHSQY
jgi:hypothetical protein